MAAPNVIRSGVGFRHARIYAVDADTGIIAPGAASATAYEGVQISGVKRLTLNDPEPQQITHMGDDAPFAMDSLPATEAMTGELVVGKVNDTVDAILTGQLSYTLGDTEMKFFGIGTSERGSEVQVSMTAWRQTLDTTIGAQQLRRWELRLLPSVLVLPLEGSLDENPEERSYTLRPQIVSKYPWGIAFADGTEGFTTAQVLRGVSVGKPHMVAWKGNGVLTQFNLPTDKAATSTDKMSVWVYDDSAGTSSIDSGATLTTSTVDPSTMPATDDIVVCVYEY